MTAPAGRARDQGIGDVTIRAEQPEDHQAISDVVSAAFGSPEVARLVEAIRESPNFLPDLSLVAVTRAEIVGHVMISFATLQRGDSTLPVAMLSPLAVAPAFQRQGLGAALVREVTARADARGEPLVVLEGSPTYYGRFGFEHSVLHGVRITLPAWAPPEAAQVLRLRSYDASLRGHVVYPPAFDEVAEH